MGNFKFNVGDTVYWIDESHIKKDTIKNMIMVDDELCRIELSGSAYYRRPYSCEFSKSAEDALKDHLSDCEGEIRSLKESMRIAKASLKEVNHERTN